MTMTIVGRSFWGEKTKGGLVKKERKYVGEGRG